MRAWHICRPVVASVLVGVAMMAALVVPAHAQATSAITLTATIDATRVVTLGGALTSNGAPLPEREINVSFNGEGVTTVRSNPGGAFTVRVSLEDYPAGNYVFEVRFPGDDEHEASAAEATVTIRPAPKGTITGQANPTMAVPGQLINITGTVKTAAGQPVKGGTVTLSAGGKTVPGSSTTTGDNGAYETVYVVPEDFTGNSLVLTARFIGDATAGEATLTWTIEMLTDPADNEPATPDPTPSVVATFPATPTAESVPTPSATPAAGESTSSGRPGGVPWLLILAIGIAVFGVLVTVGVLYRDRANRSSEPEDDDVLLDDFADEDGAPPPPAPRRSVED